MKSSVIKTVFSIFIYVATVQATPGSTTARLDPIDLGILHLDTLNWRSIPALSAPDAKQGQSFVLRAPGMPDIAVVPVRYLKSRFDTDPNPVSLRCGVYLLKQGAKEDFVKVIPGEVYTRWCTGIQAVGLMPDSGARPRLIVIFSSQTEGKHEDVVSFILTWDERKNTYQLDKPQTKWLLCQNVATDTVVNVRRVLARYHPGLQCATDE